MKRAPLLLAVLLGGVAGCAALKLNKADPDPALQLQAALEAIQRGDRDGGVQELRSIHARYATQPLGQRAMIALAAVELDPRNPHRNLVDARHVAEDLLDLPTTDAWTIPVAETFSLVAQELGAGEERIAADSGAATMTVPPFATTGGDAMVAPQRLPPLFDGLTVPQRLNRVRHERDSLQVQVDSLQQVLADREKKLRDKEKELERIRRTLRG